VSVRVLSVGAVAVGFAALLSGAVAQVPANAVQAPQSSVVNAKPQLNTPDVKNGTVYSIAQVGNTVFLGGRFTSVAPHGSTVASTRSNIVAFDATTGSLSTSFVPAVNGEVDAVIAGPSGTVYLAGAFTTVNGTAMRVAQLDVSTGQITAGWKPPVLTAATSSLVLSGSTLYVGGGFTKAGGVAHAGIVALNPSTGAVLPTFTMQLSGHHNTATGSAQGAVGAKKIEISPAGDKMVVIGNFTKVTDATGAYARDQVLRVNLSGGAASVDTGWNTGQYTAACFNGAFDSYIRDVQFSPDGRYFVIVATGGSGTNTDGTKSLCDTAARWETADSGDNVKPTWVDYTGQDSLWSVAVTGTAVYVGGHQRWLNNSNGFDYAGAGAVPRPGLGALDPTNGLPLSWNPGRNPRGAGAFALLATTTGLWVGSDTDYIGNHQLKHQRIAFFPLAGGATIPASTVGTLPGTVYAAGPLVNAHPEVLYRVDTGGPTVAATDNGPDWVADTTDPSPVRNSGSNVSSYGPAATFDSTVPPATPAAIFDTERWDPGSKNDGQEMSWDFPVTAGKKVDVRLYFANRYTGTANVGNRVFDVAIDGTPVLPNFDIVAAAGADQRATMRQFSITSDGDVNIDFTHEVENPLVNGIEIIQTDPAPPAPANGNSLLSRHLTGDAVIGSTSTVDSTTMDWTAVRGAFLVNGTLYYGTSDGTFHKRSFNGTALGTVTDVDPYHDPFWSAVNTGSGQTYVGAVTGLYAELPNVSSMFYVGGRVYYTLVGQPQLYYRYFTPDSGIIGAQEFTASDSADWSNVGGAFVTGDGSTLYYATKPDGVLHSVAWSVDHTTGTPTTVDSTNSWSAHGLFLRSDG